jgi:hypothetical protein
LINSAFVEVGAGEQSRAVASIYFTAPGFQNPVKCVRDAIMVSIRSPSTYYEIEFFADGHIEVEMLGTPSPVRTITLQEITDRVVSDVNG